MIKNLSVKLFNFFNGGIIDDQERVCKTLPFLQWSVYRWSRTCLSKSSASLMDGIFVIKDVSVKHFSFFNGGCIGDQKRVCKTLRFLHWSVYRWSRTCLPTSSAPSMECVLVTKNVSVKLFSFFSGGSICDQECVSHTLQLPQWRVYWWSWTGLSNSSASTMEDVLVIKDVSVKPFSFSNGVCTGDQERVCQSRQLL